MDANEMTDPGFESQRARLTAIAARMLGDPHEAQDVVQDSFLRWQTVDRCGIRTPAAWLTTVVQNLAIDRLRQRERGREHLQALDGEEALAETPEDVLARLFELSAAFARLRARLSEAERIAFVLHEGCEREHEEIARLLRTSAANSRQLVSRARKRLQREEWEQQEQEEKRGRQLVHEFQGALQRLDVPILITLLTDTPTVSAEAVPCGTAPVTDMLTGSAEAVLHGSSAPMACAMVDAWARGAVRSLLAHCLRAARSQHRLALA